MTRIRQILFDFDEVLATYSHERRIANLAAFAGCEHEQVRATLFTSGLETEYDSGLLDTATYLHRLGDGIGKVVDEEAWIASRIAGSTAAAGVLAHIEALDPSLVLGVLTNNGALMARAMPRILGSAFARLDGRVLCSGTLQMRKPDPATFQRALELLGWDAASTLFVDDRFANVQGARKIGMQAETATDARSLRRAFKRHGLA
ncbi:MAG: HAD-IA family hydrolase [Luteimonas sp.]|nr:HAD-IA family hydrolase [Luteimonas sp.]